MTGHRRGVLLVAGAALLWSSGGLAIKFLPLSPLSIVFHRAWIAAIMLFLVLRPARIRLNATFAMACVAYAGMIVTFVVATKWTAAANAIFLQDSGILWVLIFSPLITHEPILKRDVAAVAACLGGMTLFFAGKVSFRGEAGNTMGLLSGLFYAATILLLRRQRGAASEWTAIAGNALAAAAVLPFLSHPFHLSRSSWAVVAFLGIVQIAFAYALFVRGLNLVPAAEASIVALLEPIFNPIWVFLGLGERPTAYAIAGAMIVLAAIGFRTLAAGAPASAGIPNPD
jgi:drug/metabolite transporter (DMT)-like permease